VGGVGGEALLGFDLRFDRGQHGVEGVGQVMELIRPARQRDPVRQGSLGNQARGFRKSVKGSKHAASEQPAADQTEHE